jgi:hypothetical protein
MYKSIISNYIQELIRNIDVKYLKTKWLAPLNYFYFMEIETSVYDMPLFHCICLSFFFHSWHLSIYLCQHSTEWCQLGGSNFTVLRPLDLVTFWYHVTISVGEIRSWSHHVFLYLGGGPCLPPWLAIIMNATVATVTVILLVAAWIRPLHDLRGEGGHTTGPEGWVWRTTPRLPTGEVNVRIIVIVTGFVILIS